MGRQVGAVLLLILLFAATITPHAAESFRTFAEPAEIPERGTVLSQVVLAEGHKFTFLPPSGWALESNADEKSLTLTAHDLGAFIRLQIIAQKPGVAVEKKEQWPQKVRDRFPEGKIVQEFTCYTGGSPGIAFDVERTFENKSKLATRLAFVPFPKGTVEFQLTAAPEKIRRYHFVLNCLFTSLRVEPWPPKP